MSPLKALQSATSVNARVFHLEYLGQLKKGYWADIIAVNGNPIDDMNLMEHISFVMKNGVVYKSE